MYVSEFYNLNENITFINRLLSYGVMFYLAHTIYRSTKLSTIKIKKTTSTPVLTRGKEQNTNIKLVNLQAVTRTTSNIAVEYSNLTQYPDLEHVAHDPLSDNMKVQEVFIASTAIYQG